MITASDEERRNGWTDETLEAYLREREQAQSDTITYGSDELPQVADSNYNPHRW